MIYDNIEKNKQYKEISLRKYNVRKIHILTDAHSDECS